MECDVSAVRAGLCVATAGKSLNRFRLTDAPISGLFVFFLNRWTERHDHSASPRRDVVT